MNNKITYKPYNSYNNVFQNTGSDCFISIDATSIYDRLERTNLQ